MRNDHIAHACRAAHISPAASFHVLRHTLLPLGNGRRTLQWWRPTWHADTRMTEKHYARISAPTTSR